VIRSRRYLPQETPEVPDPRPGQEDQLATARAWALLARALDQLAPPQRGVVVMHDLDGVPMRDVAALQGVPLFTAYTRLRTGRKNLTKAIAALSAREAPEPQGEPRMATALPALLAVERGAGGLSANLRDRLLDRARETARDPGTAATADDPFGPPPPSARLPLAIAGAGAVVVVAALALLPRISGPAVTLPAGGAHARPGAGGPSASRAPVATALVPRPFVVRPAAPPIEAADPSRAPVARWSFDEPRGSGAARDLSGNGHDCQLRSRAASGPNADGAWTEGLVGGALALDGRHWLECARFDRGGRLDGELTIALWLKIAPGNPVADRQILVTRQLGTGGDRLFSLRLHQGNVELLSHVWQRLQRHAYANNGAWIHVTAVREMGRTSLYLDGALVGRSAAAQPRPLDGAGTPLLIGGLVNGPEIGGKAHHLFRGALDELALYDRALTAEEIRALATVPAPPVAGSR
jgi:hypothetical protein